jgi:hypothetical protein
MNTASKNSPPFIIWTLQRTGGTNLARQLFERSGLLSKLEQLVDADIAPAWLAKIDSQWKLHEPFNMGDEERIFGPITEGWMVSKNKKILEGAIDVICKHRLPLKHCVEMVPWEVSAALARISSRHGYRHLFLRRENAANRLLSLHFAKMSGIWGREFLANVELQEKIFSEPLPVNDLIAHEIKCTERLGRTWKLLQSLGSDPFSISFEDIYEASTDDAGRKAIYSLLEFLDLTAGSNSNEKFARDLMTQGEQGTRNAYGNFKGIQSLEKRLKQVKRPPFANRVYPIAITNDCAQSPQIVHASMDLHPKGVQPGVGFDIGGVLVVEEALLEQSTIYMVTEGGEQRVQWGIPSPAIAKMYANATNSAAARFKLNGMKCRAGSRVDFVLRYGSGDSMPLFRVQVGSNAMSSNNRNNIDIGKAC